MATSAEQIAQGAEPNELEPTAGQEPAGHEPGAEDAGGQQDEPNEAVVNLAREMGWTPREEYTGPEENYKGPEDFIRAGREIQRNTSTELKALRSTLDNISRTNAQFMGIEIKRQVEELSSRYTKAVEDGDATQAYRLSQEIGALVNKADQPATPPGPPPEAQEFAQRNGSWFQKDPLATTLAIDTCNRLAAQGYDHATQLQMAEKEVRRVYPNLFSGQMNGAKPQAGVNRPGGRAPQGNGNRVKGYADLPDAAKKACDAIVETGEIKLPPAEARALYAKNYFHNLERKS